MRIKKCEIITNGSYPIFIWYYSYRSPFGVEEGVSVTKFVYSIMGFACMP